MKFSLILSIVSYHFLWTLFSLFLWYTLLASSFLFPINPLSFSDNFIFVFCLFEFLMSLLSRWVSAILDHSSDEYCMWWVSGEFTVLIFSNIFSLVLCCCCFDDEFIDPYWVFSLQLLNLLPCWVSNSLHSNIDWNHNLQVILSYVREGAFPNWFGDHIRRR